MRRTKQIILTLLAVSFGLIGCKESPKPNPTPIPSKVTDIAITPTEVTLEEGKTVQMKATLTPENASNATELVWSISNPTVADISREGVVTATKKGEAQIICRVGTVEKKVPLVVTEKKLPTSVTAKLILNKELKVHFQVTPANKESYYNACVCTAKNFHSDRIRGKEGIAQNDRGWWELCSGKDPKNWKRHWYKGDQLYDSSSNEKIAAHYILHWDTDYVFYAYEIDEATGEPSSEVFVYEFHTPPAKPVDMTFDIEVKSTSWGHGFNATVIPSLTDKEWFYRIEPNRIWESWKKTGYKGEYDEYEQNIIFSYISSSFDGEKEPSFQKGVHNLTSDKLYKNLKPGTEYVILVFGWDKNFGPTTKITASAPFTVTE